MTDLEQARAVLAAHDNPTTRTLSRAYGEAQVGGAHTSLTGRMWECRRNGDLTALADTLRGGGR